ncbi:DUF6404 family protein, partial [Aeromonas popoffii]|uniref:DUF6404 family protein n=1 Tax=Aeromonas popoffii TaxID=70856 RepID=UPI002011E37F
MKNGWPPPIRNWQARVYVHANYNPPLCRLLRRFGYPVKPPHYEGWLTNVLVFGVGIGLVWGTMMWFFSWQPMAMDPLFALCQTTLFAGFCGLTMGVVAEI